MLKIHTLNVGLGDSIIIETSSNGKSYYSVIDCRKFGDVVPTVEFLRERNVVNLQCIFLSHLHLDHSSGLPDLIDYIISNQGHAEYFISPMIPEDAEIWSYFLENNDKSQKPVVKQLIKAIDKVGEIKSLTHENHRALKARLCYEGNKTTTAWRSDLHPDLLFAPVSPNPEEASKPLKKAREGGKISSSDMNEISHAILTKYRTNKGNLMCLFTGDLDSKKWRFVKNRCLEITDRNIRKELRFLKWPHHGKYVHGIATILNDIVDKNNPFIVSISCPPNDYKHPGKETLDLLTEGFPNSCIVCTNLSQYCQSSMTPNDGSIFDRTLKEQEFLDFVGSTPYGEIISDSSRMCAGNNSAFFSDSVCALRRSHVPVCQYTMDFE